ncbi:metalloregulator ArsR/SmtB family transcription factor [Thiomicrospira sp. R3]|uniref:ArsR/SmtB family transcription factor n=1 Tax=Thiomicrospira sp. R3 TaxID=3035472 RepID=UPI00259B101C|nr:metalloregulator ArsR/SmtB family transcription factor [Thiomicrospira sp. R3]WFE69706.1 metalloregulator ArsR/SmtB family transcription factor [Thiomicrospira sp. R3]
MELEFKANQFKALGHPARLRILNLLRRQDSLCVCELMRVLAFAQSFSSRHLAILRDAGLVETEKHGTWVHYSLTAAGQALLVDAGLDQIEMLQADLAQLNQSDCASC